MERVAREMVSRLPRLAPDRYRVVRPPAGQLGEQGYLPLLRAELIYSPANLAPIASRRNVVVIHDAAALRHPEWYSRPYAAWHRLVLPRIARRARLVITVSEFSRGEIEATLGVSATVIPNGVDERFRPTGEKGDYALVVGTRIARKNLAALDTAAAALRERGVEEPQASVLAETAVAVFRVAFERWVASDRDLTELVRESLDALRAVAVAG